MIWLPPYHDMGLVGGILEPLHSGFPVWLMSPLDFLRRPARWLEAVSRYRATTSGGPDFAYALAAARVDDETLAGLDLRSWRVAFSGAERVRPATLARFAARFAGRASTRAPSTRATGSRRPRSTRRGGRGAQVHPSAPGLVSCRVVAEGHALRIADPETGEEVGADEVGEVQLRGPSVAAGYLGRTRTGASRGRGRAARCGSARATSGGCGTASSTSWGGARDAQGARASGAGRGRGGGRGEGGAGAPGGRVAAFGDDDGERERLVVVAEVRDGAAVAVGEVAQAIDEALARELGVGLDELALVGAGELALTSSGKLRRGVCQNAHQTGTLAVTARWRG
ncbi:MAG: AMP-binding protein [Deltaproteobacteria bacterium]|nr:AMP-binding protein [Deltaproteobacteria bacterium]